jgi:hypothetical protein
MGREREVKFWGEMPSSMTGEKNFSVVQKGKIGK